jgi:hypothetical protein
MTRSKIHAERGYPIPAWRKRAKIKGTGPEPSEIIFCKYTALEFTGGFK